MTLVIPDGVGRCPRCSGAVTFMSVASIASHDMQAWTDGWGVAADGGWVRCPHCEATLPAAEMETGRAPKSALNDPQFRGAPALRAPTPEQLEAALTQHLERIPKGSDEERRARLALWRALNDRRRAEFGVQSDRASATPVSELEEKNLERLGELMQAFAHRPTALSPEGMLRVEILRELGRFAAAKAVLRDSRSELDRLESLVDAGDRTVRPRSPGRPPQDGYPETIAADMRAARAGDGGAAWRLVLRFRAGDGVPADRTAAAEWADRAARAGHPAALAEGGIATLAAGEPYFGSALRLLVSAAVSGDPDARRALHLHAAAPVEWRKRLERLGALGTPEVIPTFLGYVEAARAIASDPAGANVEAQALAGLVELLRDCIVAIVQREGADPVSTYILAKDENRPGLMERAFAPDAELEMVVKTDAISFPPLTRGLASITDVLVTRFNEGKENVRTFCISRPPGPADTQFACAWLVGFSDRRTGEVRVGCGRYEWSFLPASPRVADRLRITIEHMEALPAGDLRSVMGWLSALQYPWCPGLAAARGAPPLARLERIVPYLKLAASGLR